MTLPLNQSYSVSDMSHTSYMSYSPLPACRQFSRENFSGAQNIMRPFP